MKAALLGLLLAASAAWAGVCKGDDPCRECVNCRACKYCNSGKGSCSVKREQADRDYAARRKARATPAPAR